MNARKPAFKRFNKSSGFTIVELLIVIVIIGILAALVIISYNGIQARARDSSRLTAMRNVKSAVEAYAAENGSYPPTDFQNLSLYLVPKYIKAIPSDPINATQGGKTYVYYYVTGYKKTGPSTYAVGTANDYLFGMTLEGSTNTPFNGYGAPGTLNWLDGN